MKDVWKGPKYISFKSESILVTSKWHSQTSTCYKEIYSRVAFVLKFILTKAKGFPPSTLPEMNSTSEEKHILISCELLKKTLLKCKISKKNCQN